MGKVPDSIVTAVNNILEPYGEKFIPGGKPETALAGYKSALGARQYLGVSKSALYKLIADGVIHPIKLNKNARNGKVIFSVAELEAYVASCRS